MAHRRKTDKQTHRGEVNGFLSRLDPRVRRWLNTPDPDGSDDEASDEHYERWYLRRVSGDQLFDVGGVTVDRALLETRFACVPERCSPAAKRDRYRSCCADLTVYLTPAERHRLVLYKNQLSEYLAEREPRLERLLKPRGDRVPRFFLDEDGDALCRPARRCVFSQIDARDRIRCHLHAMVRKLGIDRTDLQPITCRLFPLVLVHLPRGRVLVTAITRENYRAWGGKHPRYFPCLSDDGLPPVLKSMAPTLDWLFGEGFVRAVKREAR